jgi:2-dehydropantoate 2-reductase
VGLGGIGSCWAFQLARAGHSVSALARAGSKREKQLRQDGAVIRSNPSAKEAQLPEALRQPITVVNELGATPYDAVIVTVLAHQLSAQLLESLITCSAQQILLCGNRFDLETPRNLLGSARCVFGMPMQQAFVEIDGRCHMVTDSMGQSTLLGEQRWVDIFNAAGLPSVFEPDMAHWLRCHVPMAIAFESVCVIAERDHAGAAWADAMRVARAAQQGFALLIHQGYKLHPAKSKFHNMPAWMLAGILWGATRVTSFRQLLATGAVECRALIDILSAEAAKTNFDTSLLKDVRPPSEGEQQNADVVPQTA